MELILFVLFPFFNLLFLFYFQSKMFCLECYFKMFGILTFFKPPALSPLQRFPCFILEKNYSKNNSIVFLSSLKICFGTVVINDCKTIFDIIIGLYITIFPSSVSFLIFYIFKPSWIFVTKLTNFSPFSIFPSKRIGYVIFLTYQYSDLYNAYHRLFWTPFRTPILAVSDFVKIGSNPEKYKKQKHQPYPLQK